MTKNTLSETASSESSSLKTLVLEKYDLKKEVLAIDREIRQIQTQQESK
jgi:hypothetical protein